MQDTVEVIQALNLPSDIPIEKLPRLNSLLADLDQHTPHSYFDTFRCNHYDETNTLPNIPVQSKEQREKDIKRLIGIIQTRYIKRMVDYDSRIVKALISEREFKVQSNGTTDQREAFPGWYNKQVLAMIDRYCNHIISHLDGIFSPYFTNEHIERLNIKKYFERWNEHFDEY